MQEPVTLHKYLYANASPVMYTDPTGMYSLASVSIANTVAGTLQSFNMQSSMDFLGSRVEGTEFEGAVKTAQDVSFFAGIAGLGVAGTKLLILGSKKVRGAFAAASAGKTRVVRKDKAVAINAINLKNAPAWKLGSDVITEVVPAGTRYRMVLEKRQYDSIVLGKDTFGGWATLDNVTTKAYARNELAISRRFKADVSYVITVETSAPQMVRRGIAGRLDGADGGGSQVEFLGLRNLRFVPNSLKELR